MLLPKASNYASVPGYYLVQGGVLAFSSRDKIIPLPLITCGRNLFFLHLNQFCLKLLLPANTPQVIEFP